MGKAEQAWNHKLGLPGSWEPSYDKPLYDDPPPPYEMTLHEAVAAIKELQNEVAMLNAWKVYCESPFRRQAVTGSMPRFIEDGNG